MRAAVKKFIEENIELIENDQWSEVVYKAETWMVDNKFTMLDLVDLWKIIREDLKIDLFKFEDVEVVPTCYFYGSNITAIKLPERIAHIRNSAFTNCEKLEKVSLPSTIISIGEGAFLNTDNLIEINYNGYESDFRNIRLGYCAFGVNSLGRNGKKLIARDDVMQL